MDSSFDISFNASELLEDHQLDTTDLLLGDDDLVCKSPIKKPAYDTKIPSQSLSSISLPDLACLFLGPLPSNDLFLVTHHLRQEQGLKNDKIEKLLLLLQSENSNFELDDQLRTRVFKARASRNAELDSFDIQLDSYLRETAPGRATSPQKRKPLVPMKKINENKENSVPALEPSKRKLSDSVRRPPLKKSKSYSSILQSSKPDNLSNTLVPGLRDVRFSPQRVCVPKSTSLPGKPSLKPRENLHIFLVDSLTGSMADATQFGTELNASNCEGFPLPDNIHEVVQIPTNDTVTATSAPKMAIIKALMGKFRANETKHTVQSKNHKGFYSKREFDELRTQPLPEVAIFNDSEKRVRWADELEW